VPVMRFSHYNLRAPRPLLEQLRDFYVSSVGLRNGPRPPFSVFGYWLYAGEEPVLHLAESSAEGFLHTPAGASFAHVAFACTDLPGAEARLVRQGVSFRRSAVPGSGDPQLFFLDPAGNGVELLFERNARATEGGPPPPRSNRGW
jgi:catechol 2,3-dioxygenase-like lactoylglutathione lyase family enzyme